MIIPNCNASLYAYFYDEVENEGRRMFKIYRLPIVFFDQYVPQVMSTNGQIHQVPSNILYVGEYPGDAVISGLIAEKEKIEEVDLYIDADFY